MQRRHQRLGLGNRNPQLLIYRAGRRAGAVAAPGERLFLDLPALRLGLELREHASRIHDVGMLVRVATQEFVERLALFVDPRRHAAWRRGAEGREVERQLRVFAGQLAPIGIPALLGGAQVDTQLADLLRQRGDPAEIVLVGHAGDAKIANLEILQAVLGVDELALVAVDLLVDECSRLLRVALLVAGARIDEQAHGRGNETARPLGTRAAVGDVVEIASARRNHLDVAHQPRDDAITLRGIAPIELERRVGDQLLDVRPRDEGSGQHADLLVDVRLERQALHQRLEHRLGVDVHAGSRLIAVVEHRDADGRAHCDDRHRRERKPTAPPRDAAGPSHLDDQRVAHLYPLCLPV